MKMFVFLMLLLALPVYASTSGTINFTWYNATTGLFGYTVGLCNATADCFHYKCFLDYDGNYLGSGGTCDATAVTNCFHDGSVYATGTYSCRSNVTYHQCSSGAWSGLLNCTSGTCVGGTSTCSSSSPGSGPGSGPGTNTTINIRASAIFSAFPSNFDIVQGTTTTKNLAVKNNGNQTLYNVTVALTGISWYNVTPSKISSMSINSERGFNITFVAPENAEIKTYQLTVTFSSNNFSTTKPLAVTVKPSEQTAQTVIVPDYGKYNSLLQELQANLTNFERMGANVENVTSLLLNAQSKLAQANTAIEAKDYASASLYLDEAKGLLDAAAAKMLDLKPPSFHIDPVVLVIILVAIGIAAFVLYLLLPAKEERKSLAGHFGLKKKK